MKQGLVFDYSKEDIPPSQFTDEPELFVNRGGIEHILVEGENLIALELLKKDYCNKIDVVCIDPPYNTGITSLTYRDSDYLCGGSYSHGPWLSFMSNRLASLFQLLSDRGVLFINIDEHEFGPLLLLCHSIFREPNVDVLIWPKTDSRFDKNRIEKPLRDIKIVHEYIVVCFKNRVSTPLRDVMMPRLVDGEYVDEPSPLESIVRGLGTTSSAKDELEEIFGSRTLFQTPKPMRLIKELIRAASGKQSVVLDVFAGSGTTGHATMALNMEDGGERQFVLVNDNSNNICREITYKRLQRVIDTMRYCASLRYLRVTGACCGQENEKR